MDSPPSIADIVPGFRLRGAAAGTCAQKDHYVLNDRSQNTVSAGSGGDAGKIGRSAFIAQSTGDIPVFALPRRLRGSKISYIAIRPIVRASNNTAHMGGWGVASV